MRNTIFLSSVLVFYPCLFILKGMSRGTVWNSSESRGESTDECCWFGIKCQWTVMQGEIVWCPLLIRTYLQSLCCWWLISVLKLLQQCSADSTASAQLADLRQRVTLQPHPKNVWFNQHPFCRRLLSFLSRVIFGPCCLPRLHMWMFFLNTRLFRIVYGRQRSPEPEPHSC